MQPPGGWQRFSLILLALLALNFVIASQVPDKAKRVKVPYTYFRDQVEAGNVKDVSTRGDAIQGDFKAAVHYPDAKADARTKFETQRPSFGDDNLLPLLIDKNVEVNAQPIDPGRGVLANFLLFFGPTLLLVGFFMWFARRSASLAGGGIAGFGRSRAKRYEHSEQRVTFADVAGIDEAEEELEEIVDFLKHPDRYRQLGAMIPKGVLLVGAPGHRQDAAGARRRRRGRRAVLLDLRLGVHRDVRRASARAACATSSPRPRPSRRRSSSSTSSTRSAARAAAGRRSAATTSASRRSTRSSPRWTASRAPRA